MALSELTGPLLWGVSVFYLCLSVFRKTTQPVLPERGKTEQLIKKKKKIATSLAILLALQRQQLDSLLPPVDLAINNAAISSEFPDLGAQGRVLFIQQCY